MLRRSFILSTPGSILAIGLAVSGCTMTGSTSDASGEQMDKRHSIDAGVDSTLGRLYNAANGSRELVGKARGVLVFPSVIDAGFGVGGQYGEGALRIDGKNVAYYNITSASVGLTLGLAKHREVILFMTQEVLDKFTTSHGWTIGADTGVAVLSKGAGGEYDTKTLQRPILGIVFGEKGLIGDISLEGSKVTKLER